MNFKAVLALPKTAGFAQTDKSISFIWIVWSTICISLNPSFKDQNFPLSVIHITFGQSVGKPERWKFEPLKIFQSITDQMGLESCVVIWWNIVRRSEISAALSFQQTGVQKFVRAQKKSCSVIIGFNHSWFTKLMVLKCKSDYDWLNDWQFSNLRRCPY